MTQRDGSFPSPATSGDTGAWGARTAPAPDPRATVYGPAIVGTIRVDDPRAPAALRAAHPPAVPAPPPQPVYQAVPMALAWQQAPASGQIEVPRPRVPRLAVVGAMLAVTVPPIGCVVSAVALGRILAATPRPRGETLAALSIAASIVAMAAALVAVMAS